MAESTWKKTTSPSLKQSTGLYKVVEELICSLLAWPFGFVSFVLFASTQGKSR